MGLYVAGLLERMSLKNEALKGKEVLVWWLDSNHVEQLGVIYESPSTLLKRLNKPDASSDQRIPLYLPNGEIVYRVSRVFRCFLVFGVTLCVLQIFAACFRAEFSRHSFWAPR